MVPEDFLSEISFMVADGCRRHLRNRYLCEVQLSALLEGWRERPSLD